LTGGRMKHKHKWKFYNGWLGYESRVCSICNIDFNDLSKEEQNKEKKA